MMKFVVFFLSLAVFICAHGQQGSFDNRADRLWASFEASKEYRPTFGIEIEGIIKSEIGLYTSAKILASLLSEETGEIYLTHKFNFLTDLGGLRTGFRISRIGESNKNKTWEIKQDGSIKPPSEKYVGVELATPVMQGYQDRELFYTILSKLSRAIGYLPQRQSAGLHFHVGFPSPQKGEILFLFYLFQQMEPDLFKVFNVHPSRQHYAQTLPDQILSPQALRMQNTHSLNEMISKYFDGKYFSVNPWSLFSLGTVEFRFSNGTMDLEQIKNIWDFLGTLTSMIRLKDKKVLWLAKRLEAHRSPTSYALDWTKSRADWFLEKALVLTNNNFEKESFKACKHVFAF